MGGRNCLPPELVGVNGAETSERGLTRTATNAESVRGADDGTTFYVTAPNDSSQM